MPTASEPRGGRLSLAVLAIWPFGQILPLAVLLVTDALPAAVAGVLLGLTLVANLVRWLRFTWRLEGGALIVEQGLLSRSRRVIPFERIQGVDLVRKVRHRIFGVVEVRVEVVGGSQTEGRLDAIALSDAQRLRDTLLHARQRPVPEEPEAPAGELLVHMTPAQLVLAGVTGGRVGVAAALLGAAQELFSERLSRLFTDLPDLLSPAGLVALAASLLVAAFILSVIATTVVYWDFRLLRVGDELQIRRGLLEQRLDTIPLRRVQALRIEENLLRRVFSLAAVKVDVAGRAGGDDAREAGLLLPLGTRREARELVATILGVPGLADAELLAHPRRALRRRLVRAVVVTAVLTAPAVVLAGPPGLTVALLGVPAVAAAYDAYRALGSTQVDGYLVARYGVVVRRTFVVGTRNVQSLALTSTPFQRAAHLATLELQIARSPRAGGTPRLLDIGAERGADLLAALVAPQPAVTAP
jgi:putative membrane protein